MLQIKEFQNKNYMYMYISLIYMCICVPLFVINSLILDFSNNVHFNELRHNITKHNLQWEFSVIIIAITIYIILLNFMCCIFCWNLVPSFKINLFSLSSYCFVIYDCQTIKLQGRLIFLIYFYKCYRICAVNLWHISHKFRML